MKLLEFFIVFARIWSRWFHWRPQGDLSAPTHIPKWASIDSLNLDLPEIPASDQWLTAKGISLVSANQIDLPQEVNWMHSISTFDSSHSSNLVCATILKLRSGFFSSTVIFSLAAHVEWSFVFWFLLIPCVIMFVWHGVEHRTKQKKMQNDARFVLNVN